MDMVELLKLAPELGAHGILVILVYVLWRRVAKLETLLLQCLQSGGKVNPVTVDTLPLP